MEYLDLEDVLMLHADLIAQSGGSDGVRDLGAVESAVAQPRWVLRDRIYIQHSLKKPPR